MAGRGATIVRRTREWRANERVVEVPVSHAPVIKHDEIPIDLPVEEEILMSPVERQNLAAGKRAAGPGRGTKSNSAPARTMKTQASATVVREERIEETFEISDQDKEIAVETATAAEISIMDTPGPAAAPVAGIAQSPQPLHQSRIILAGIQPAGFAGSIEPQPPAPRATAIPVDFRQQSRRILHGAGRRSSRASCAPE